MSATTPQRLFLARLSYSSADRAGTSARDRGREKEKKKRKEKKTEGKKTKQRKERDGSPGGSRELGCADELSNGRKIAAIKAENTSSDRHSPATPANYA